MRDCQAARRGCAGAGWFKSAIPYTEMEDSCATRIKVKRNNGHSCEDGALQHKILRPSERFTLRQVSLRRI
jgi:hypothetical protein